MLFDSHCLINLATFIIFIIKALYFQKYAIKNYTNYTFIKIHNHSLLQLRKAWGLIDLFLSKAFLKKDGIIPKKDLRISIRSSVEPIAFVLGKWF